MTDKNAVNDDAFFSHRSDVNGTVREKFIDLMEPAFQAEFSPEEADLAGAFSEDALTEQDALESASDALE